MRNFRELIESGTGLVEFLCKREGKMLKQEIEPEKTVTTYVLRSRKVEIENKGGVLSILTPVIL